ncbi:MAG TPA: N-acetyltransferase [Deltaproteobacteria bacterium]|nr:N-acetyltransferase [Deltaproteobacteria bacterium]HPR53540.1 N-acetyltransferase [Deltaproteobacteria bacterium]HXK46123.1 N-acetyltransferase [Deltaproteobacteria bacterium]
MIRKPAIAEADQIKSLIDPFVKEGLILPRSLHSLYTTIRDFWVDAGEEDPGFITGCCALHISWNDLAEIRTLAVRREFQGKGDGIALVEACLREARALGVRKVFTLTYVPEFFKKVGFFEVDKSKLPNKIWADCIHCQYFPDCREIALVYDL